MYEIIILAGLVGVGIYMLFDWLCEGPITFEIQSNRRWRKLHDGDDYWEMLRLADEISKWAKKK